MFDLLPSLQLIAGFEDFYPDRFTKDFEVAGEIIR